jgi:hypothetical protein
MGLFDALFGRRPPARVQIGDDQIWLSHAARFRGIVREVASLATSDTDAILVVAHFANVLEVLQPIAETSLVTIPKLAVLAEELTPALAQRLSLDEQASVDLIVAERHPLPKLDEAIVTFAEKLACRSRIRYHLSLDDVVMQKFSGEWVRNTLKNLGMTDEESIQSKMVTRRIKAAQKKFEELVKENHAASSAEEWVRLNAPEADGK